MHNWRAKALQWINALHTLSIIQTQVFTVVLYPSPESLSAVRNPGWGTDKEQCMAKIILETFGHEHLAFPAWSIISEWQNSVRGHLMHSETDHAITDASLGQYSRHLDVKQHSEWQNQSPVASKSLKSVVKDLMWISCASGGDCLGSERKREKQTHHFVCFASTLKQSMPINTNMVQLTGER